ncbi:sugar ABC transporter ATP-binding protein [Brucepastera parasyntrophica]|uniref:sugar ABC transporter ATP-binding protein n=1 Tax=Brucepastera parasyntrophica TaxID=2880008 RepID=UPI00210905A6|nr:sugar ABC transporter ATP-binding protein [Brucepastera parasyntrophica]ULQ60857.1 sugar ABC transporter ATP-binding protein [Brucepastera parasyntrophica]
MDKPILEMSHITKEFPGVRALDDVTFKVAKGEIHFVVGENGAGKSTLMKVLSGIYPYGTYEGDILIDGEIQRYNSIRDSEHAGLAIIYQELALVPDLSIYENIYLGNEQKKGHLIDWNETIRKAKSQLEKVRLNIDPSTKVRNLSVGTQQLIEIAKALSKDVRLLILDEPTAALNDDDSDNLLNLILELKKQGVTCIMISHKLKEVMQIADTVTILRDGKTVKTLKRDELNEEVIIKNMVGREIENIYPKRENVKIGDVQFEVKNWTVYDYSVSREILTDINLYVRKGEVLGIAGLMGAGRTEFALSIFGNPRNYRVSGEMIIKGQHIQPGHPKNAIDAGLAYVSEDRKKDGLILDQDVKQNLSIASLKDLTNRLTINKNEEILIAEEIRKDLKIKTPSVEAKVRNLSGGNQQKVSLGKWLIAKPDILILDEPTRGIDVGAKYEIYTIMNKLVEQGMSIIMISSELPEILGMSDRIYVIAEGRITGEISGTEATQEKIMKMATV